MNQGNDIKYVCEEIETSLSTVLGYIYDYIKEGNCINFNIDLESMYEQKDKAMILDACERFSEDKISVIKKSLPDYIKYENIRAVILEKYI